MKFFIKFVLLFFVIISNAYSFETSVGPSGGRGYVLLDDGTRIDGLWKVERGNLTKCKNCKLKYADGNIIESNIITHESTNNYIPSGKFKFTGNAFDSENRSYFVVVSGNASTTSSGWSMKGKVNVIYKNEESVFNVNAGTLIGDLLKEKYYSKPVVKVETKKKNTQSNKSKIDLAKSECSELGLESGTEKFADCVLQFSK